MNIIFFNNFFCRNFGLLSFGEEAEEDEEQTDSFVQKNAGKSKSTHDVLDDPQLSKHTLDPSKSTEHENDPIEQQDQHSDDDLSLEEKAQRIRNKLKGKLKSLNNKDNANELITAEKPSVQASESDSDDFTSELEKERRIKRQIKAYIFAINFYFSISILFIHIFCIIFSDEIRDEIKALKKEYKTDRKVKEETIEVEEKSHNETGHKNEMVQEYLSEQRKYSNLKKDVPKKGDQR